MKEDIFLYKSFEIADDKQTVRFFYTIRRTDQTYELAETLTFPVALPENDQTRACLKALHLGLGISYYKIFVNSRIEHPYAMDQEEADFWNNVFQNGLGEFLYVNKLSAEKIARFGTQDGVPLPLGSIWQPEEKALLGIGGGKDSIVAGELLKQLDIPLLGFVMATGEQLGQSKSVADTMQINLASVERRLDTKLLELQERPDAYKGHIPISLIFGLVGSLLAVAHNASYVVVANESSASIPRVEWEGNAVNHQWSKSFGFEQQLQQYLHTHVSPHLTYFSAIRPLSSVAIARIFANFSQYFEVFTSDNSIFRIDPSKRPNGRWSMESPKSLSSFILLSPWLSETDLMRTFGWDFLDQPSLEKLFYELVGLEGHQPLDCVGTEDELLLSLNLAVKQGKFAQSFLVKKAMGRGIITDENWQAKLELALKPAPEQAFPAGMSDRLLPLLTPPVGPLERFRGKSVVFVGAGKGRSMAGIQYFLEKFGQIGSFTSVDKKDGDQPLEFLKTYDPEMTVFIKNEAIPGSEMPVPYITSMQLFFELVPATGATTIGITGTKGKTTTAALTAHILEQAGKSVVLAGNIGISPFMKLNEATKDTVFVLELSSYQLSDLQASPHISACINLYNDHTDWHGSLESYWEAKHNIMRFAGPNDVFIYNPDFEPLQQWAQAASCKTKPIDPTEDFDLSRAKLFGDHNRLNVLIARQIVHEFSVTDEVIQRAVESFEPIEHRMELVGTKQNRIYINDAIGMTPESTIASLKAIHEKYGQIGCLLLGGQDRNYDFSGLMQLVADLQIPSLVFFPDTEAKMQEAMPDGYHPEILATRDMGEAVQFAATHAPEQTAVLLSTAAPSYLLWKDFEEKGTQFKQAVGQI